MPPISESTKVFFAGYAPVHYICFRPIHEALARAGNIEVVLSGGLRTVTEESTEYDLEALYGQFDLPPCKLVPVEDLGAMDFDAAFSAQTKMIQPGSADLRVQIFHGISFRNRAVRPENRGYDHYFLVGPYMRRNFEDAGLFEPGDPRAVEVGFPKTDRLINGTLDRNELLARYGFDGSRPVVLYAPTGQKGNSLEKMGEEVIEKLTASGQCDLILKLHDHPKKDIDWKERLARFGGPHFKLATDLDVIPLLFLADLLISDASSVTSEFSLLDRPMVFLDVPKLIAKAEARENSRLDLETWGRKGGHLARTPEEAVDLVTSSLANPGELSEIRQAMARDLFYNPGQATEAAADWIARHLHPRAQGAAAR
ncbi:MAG: hypothetical protein HKN82_05640 [Akkermansiaceae bacterium]|nr:hypothetical protein [Akkermansiaceae bacterium]